jgi:hypothetical protein
MSNQQPPSKYKVEIENRKNKYFNSYDYRASLVIEDIQRMRYYSSYDDYASYISPYSGNSNNHLFNKDELERYFDYKDSLTHDCMLRIEFNKLYIYANDLAHLDYAVDKIAPIGAVKYYQVNSPKEMDTIEFSREPKYKFRNYFKCRSITLEAKAALLNFITEQQFFGAELAFNDSMMRWLRRPPYRGHGGMLQESYYIEYNDNRMEMVFSLAFGEYLKPRIYKLVKREP